MGKRLAALAGVFGLLGVASIVSAADALELPFFLKFDKPLDAVWKADVSKDNKIEVADGALRISAAANTYAHIERPLGADPGARRVRAEAWRRRELDQFPVPVIEGVTINGVESKSFTADTVTLTRMDKSTTVEVRYEP